MSRAVPYNDILAAVLSGVSKAFSIYYKWSDGLLLSFAPESFVQTEIARSIAKTCSCYITLEDTVRDILHNAKAELRGRKPRSRASGRVDIIVWWDNETPRLLIEVKKAWNKCAIDDDVKRLRQLVNRGGSLQGGLVVVYTVARKSSTVNKLFQNMSVQSNTTLIRQHGPVKRNEDDGIWYWGAACFSV